MTIEEKYKWLLSKLKVSSIDYWENDAYLEMPGQYFQFWRLPEDMDTVVEMAIRDEQITKELKEKA